MAGRSCRFVDADAENGLGLGLSQTSHFDGTMNSSSSLPTELSSANRLFTRKVFSAAPSVALALSSGVCCSVRSNWIRA